MVITSDFERGGSVARKWLIQVALWVFFMGRRVEGGKQEFTLPGDGRSIIFYLLRNFVARDSIYRYDSK